MFALLIAHERVWPSCKGSFVERQKREGLLIQTVCWLTGMRPYLCFDCDTLFLAPKQPRATAGQNGSKPPDLG